MEISPIILTKGGFKEIKGCNSRRFPTDFLLRSLIKMI